jgi:hypothetical protein
VSRLAIASRLPPQPEAHFQRVLETFAALRGWKFYHVHDSRRDQPGFPDLVLVRRDRLVISELKNETGRVRPAQKDWLAALEAVTHPPEVHLWRPQDWEEIERVLT